MGVIMPAAPRWGKGTGQGGRSGRGGRAVMTVVAVEGKLHGRCTVMRVAIGLGRGIGAAQGSACEPVTVWGLLFLRIGVFT